MFRMAAEQKESGGGAHAVPDGMAGAGHVGGGGSGVYDLEAAAAVEANKDVEAVKAT